MKNKLSIAFLWHMHQPLYKDLLTGKYYLPWVRLHSTYSYLDMISILDDFPAVKVTFNITPSLMWQLLDISRDKPIDDIYLDLSKKNAADLTDEEKTFLLKNFFSCSLERSILPVKRYNALFLKRGDSLQKKDLLKKIKDFSASDFRDLQVLFNLAWCGFTLREKNTLIRRLVHKGYDYTEDDKLSLLKLQKETVASILPVYKRMQDEGRIEISSSPFYHPILPLLCGDVSSEESDFLEDARAQINKAVVLYKEVFGRNPSGIWPPEGGVSQSIIPILADEGIKWIATDERILLESFKAEGVKREELIYKVFSAEEENKKIDIIFRDVNMSNAISFRYAHLPVKKAVAEFVGNLRKIQKSIAYGKKPHMVPIILDGENPWPYFQEGGKFFLSEMYRQLSLGNEFELSTITKYLTSNSERQKIDRLFSGSWIDCNFDKWIGSPQKKRAWEYLKKARKELVASGWPNPEALEELYIAEGSDWFWWYDDFGTELNFVFDELYRLHLRNIYDLIGKNVPYYLKSPIHGGPHVQKIQHTAAPLEMARLTKILMVSSECVPYAKTGGLADVTASLSKALISLGLDVRVIMPAYKDIASSKTDFKKEAVNVKNFFSKDTFDLYSIINNGIKIYFIHNDKYFAGKDPYGTDKGDYPDNGLRFGLFSQAVLCAIKILGFTPDIIHCNDWQTALIPFYLKFSLKDDENYKTIKTLFTIHNMAYQGIFDKKIMKSLNIPERFFNMNDLEFYGKLNFMKAGILYSDAVNTVSPRYAEQIMTSEYGAGLNGLLATRKNVFYGILNGVDYSIWNPKNDSFIKVNFDRETIEKKIECKKDLLEYTHLPISLNAPLLGCVTRLAGQKGMDLLAAIVDKIVKMGCGLVILGRGNSTYNKLFSDIANKYPQNLFVCNDFSDELAHKIEAGCDIFVMPSRYEPCGLNQIYSIKYGTIPVVRATGGLDDVIVDFDEDRENANGFKFGPPTKMALYNALKRAVDLYNSDKTLWKKLMLRAMKYDFSWDKPAKQYLALYGKIMTNDKAQMTKEI